MAIQTFKHFWEPLYQSCQLYEEVREKYFCMFEYISSTINFKIDLFDPKMGL